MVIYKLGDQSQLKFCSIYTNYKLTFFMDLFDKVCLENFDPELGFS